MINLKGKVSLVTGASRGIGKAIAMALAEAGSDVALNYHTHREPAEEVAAEIHKLGRKAVVYQADVSHHEENDAMVARIKKDFDHVHIVVNNAGITRDKSFVKMDREMWHDVLDVNLTGPARYLMFGPLLHLPPGRWRASIVFRVDDNLSGNTLMSDVVADNQICNTGEGVLPPSGVFSFEIDFVVRDPRLPVAVRLATRSGAIEGTLELLSAEVRELADDEEFITRSVS